MTSLRLRRFFPILVLLAIAASQGAELFVNRVLRPDVQEVTWIGDVVLAAGFVIVTWLWIELRETQITLTDLERRQIVAETQLTIAARVQESLLPAVPPASGGISWHATVEPAHKIGGDYYDFLPLADGRMCVVLADVSGKGVAAAIFVANVRAILRTLACDITQPSRLLSGLSTSLIADSTSGLYVTCIVAVVDASARSMVYVNAGHPAGVLWSPHGIRPLQIGGPPAGLLNDARFEEETVEFANGDLVVLVSDGITEALDVSGQAAIDAIALQIELAERRTPEAVCARLLGATRRSTGPRDVDGWMDDRTAVAFGVIA